MPIDAEALKAAGAAYRAATLATSDTLAMGTNKVVNSVEQALIDNTDRERSTAITAAAQTYYLAVAVALGHVVAP